MKKFLVVGGDQGIGYALFKELSYQAVPVMRTTRRKDRRDAFFLDLTESSRDMGFASGVTCAFLCAAISGFADCEQDMTHTRKANVDGLLEVARTLLGKDCFVIFLSSSAVFDGSTQWPDESEKCAPTTEYGRQKVLAENLLLEMDGGRGNVAIVRLTKVLTSETPVINRMLNKLHHGGPVEAFPDLRISPVSLEYVVTALLLVASKKVGGIFHLSGESEINYIDFARMMATSVGADPSLVKEVDSSRAMTYFKPEFPGLGMRKTKETLGLQPEPIENVLKTVLSGL